MEISIVLRRAFFLTLLFIQIIVQPQMGQNMNVQTYNMRDGLSQMKVSALFEDSRGYIWIGTRNGLNRFNGMDFQILTTADGLLNNRILGIAEMKGGDLLIVTAGGISIFNGVKFNNYPYSFPRVLYKLQQDEFGYIYIFSKAVYSFHPDEGIVQLYDQVHHFGMDRESEKVIFLTADSVMQLVAGQIIQRKAYHANPKFWSQNPAISEAVLAQDGSSDSFHIFSLEKNAWIPKGSIGFRKGQVSLVDHCFRDSLFLKSGAAYRLPLKGGFCMIKSKAENYFIGTDEGLVRYNPTAFQNVSTEKLPYAWSMIDSKESIFFGNYGYGLIGMDKATGMFRKMNTDYDLYHCGASTDGRGTFYFSNNNGLVKLLDNSLELIALSLPVLYNIYDQHRNQVVLGVDFGIALVDSLDNFVIKNEAGLFHDNHYIQNITIGPDRNYWCGSYTGLTQYNPDIESTYHYTSDQNNLPIGPGVFSGLVDSKNRLWLGGSNGLCYFDPIQQKLERINSPMLTCQIKSIIELSPTTLLLGTKNELLTFKIQTYFDNHIVDVDYYNDNNGYTGIEPGYTGFHRDREQNVWISSASHMSVLKHPYGLTENQPLNAQILSIGGKGTRFSMKSDTIGLNTHENILVNVEAVGLDRPSTVQFALRMDAGQWTVWQEEDQFVLDNLSHGPHFIEVAAGPGTKNQELLASAHVMVALPLFQRDFFLPTLLTLLALIVIYTIYITWRRRMERRAFLMQVEESRYLRSQLLLSELNPHFIFNVLASIQNKILKGEKEEANNKLVQLSSLIRNFLNVSFKSNDPKNKLEHEITLDREIELLRSYLAFEQSNSNNHFNFDINIDRGCEPTQIMIPPMLIQPFVENAVKHGVLPKHDKGLIELHFRYKENVLFCEILDDGLGIQQTKQKANSMNRMSLGSTIVKERIAALNQIGYQIEVNIGNREGGGTRVQIIIQE